MSCIEGFGSPLICNGSGGWEGLLSVVGVNGRVHPLSYVGVCGWTISQSGV